MLRTFMIVAIGTTLTHSAFASSFLENKIMKKNSLFKTMVSADNNLQNQKPDFTGMWVGVCRSGQQDAQKIKLRIKNTDNLMSIEYNSGNNETVLIGHGIKSKMYTFDDLYFQGTSKYNWVGNSLKGKEIVVFTYHDNNQNESRMKKMEMNAKYTLLDKQNLQVEFKFQGDEAEENETCNLTRIN